MTPIRTLCQLFLFGVAAACLNPAQAALGLTVSVDVSKVPNRGAKAAPVKIKGRIELVLGETFVSVRSGDETRVFDFERRRMLVLDTTKKIYDDYSLYADVAYRSAVLQNLSYMENAVDAVQVEHKLPGEVEREHHYSVQVGSVSKIAEHVDGGYKVFSGAGGALLRRSSAGTPVSAAEADRFAKYLRYTIGGHPAILQALQKEQRIPARLTFHFNSDRGKETLELTFSTPREVGAPLKFLPDGYRPRMADEAGDPLDAAIDRAWNGPAALGAGDNAGAGASFDAALRDGRPFDAMLAIMEIQLGAPGDLPDLTDEQKRQLEADPSGQELLPALGANEKEGRKIAIRTLQSLQSKATTGRHVLKLYESDHQVMLGDYRAARALLVDVLRANPRLAETYKDAGAMYAYSYDMKRAWRCWDIGRRLAPAFPNLVSITDFEKQLAQQFPEYF